MAFSEDWGSIDPNELKIIMESGEGAFLYLMTHLFPFEYLKDEVV